MTTIIEHLRSLTETTIGRQMKTPKDFSWLSDRIYERLHQRISPTTLKRVWGYQKDEGPARPATYNILSQFCGFSNWESFQQNTKSGEPQSAVILSRHLQTNNMEKGTQIRLCWAPNRVCEIEYVGNRKFHVLHSLNAKLKVGSTFECDVFIEQEPLYVYNLKIDKNTKGVCYYAGRKDGIRFEIIQDKTKK